SASNSATPAPMPPPSAPTSSRNDPRGVARTGVPLASASRTFTGQGSSHCTGIHRQRAPASSSRLRAPPTSPTNLTQREELRRHPPATINLHGTLLAAATAIRQPLTECRRARKRSKSAFLDRNSYSSRRTPLSTQAE